MNRFMILIPLGQLNELGCVQDQLLACNGFAIQRNIAEPAAEIFFINIIGSFQNETSLSNHISTC